MPIPTDDGLLTLLAIAVAALVVGLVAIYAGRLSDMPRQLRYLNMEIERSVGYERRRWKQRKRKYLISLIPFYWLFTKNRDSL